MIYDIIWRINIHVTKFDRHSLSCDGCVAGL